MTPQREEALRLLRLARRDRAAKLVDDLLAWAAQCIGDAPDETAIS